MAYIPYLPSFYVGRGVDSITGKPYGTGITFAGEQAETTGQKSVLMLESIESSSELTDKLDIDASASLTNPAWNVSAKFSMLKSQEINRYYTYALVRVVVENPASVIRNPQLRPEALNLLETRGWNAFTAAYGLEYIEGKVTGGSYYGLIEIQTTTQTEQMNVKAKLSGAYGPFKGDGSTDITLKEVTKNITTNVLVVKSGGSGDPLEITLEKMLGEARTFPQRVKEHPVTIAVLTADYRSTVPLPPDIDTPDSQLRIQQRNVLADLSQAYLRLRDYKASVDFVLQHFSEFDEFRKLDTTALETERKKYEDSLTATAAELNKIVRQSKDCSDNYSQCPTSVQTINFLPLPTIGGTLMNLQQMEQKLAAIEAKFANDLYMNRLIVNQSPKDANDQWSNLMYLRSTKGEPPYMNLEHGPNGKEMKIYGVIQAGHFGVNAQDDRFSIVAKSNAKLDLKSDNHINLWGPYVYVDNDVHVKGAVHVGGEIRGKMRYSKLYRWEQGQPHVKLIHCTEGFAVLTSVGGSFQGGGEWVKLYVANDGYWYLGGDSMQQGVSAEAICVGKV